MEAQKKNKITKFRQLPDEKKKKMVQNAKQKNKDGIVVIVECHPKCKVYEQLPEFRYLANPAEKLKQVDRKIKEKIGKSDKKLASQSVFLFSQNKLLNREQSFEDLNNKYKNFKDGVLYIYFANVQSFF